MIKIRFLLLLALSIAITAKTSAESAPKDELPSAEIIADEGVDLNDAQIENIMKDFGQHIKNMMTDEIDKLVEDVKTSSNPTKTKSDQVKSTANNLEQFKRANNALSRDTQERIENAGKKNNGEITQSGLNGNSEANKSLLQQVNTKLQTAGSFITRQISSLSGIAPKLRGKLAKIPSALRKLMHWPSFLKYKIKFNKVYKSLREELYRQMIYLQTQTIVGIQNLKYLCGKVSHLLKATQFSDWTGAEYKKVYDNEEAESPETTPDIKKMTDSQRAYLSELAKSGKTIFGRAAPEAGPDVEMNMVSRRRRRKRSSSSDTEMVDYNELDDDDDEEMSEADEFKDAQDNFDTEMKEDEEESDSKDSSKIVEEFAAQFDEDADLSNVEDLDNILDEALNEKQNFEPIDLRKTNCILEPENQDSCGACYAYVTMSAASYFNCINSDKREVMRYNPRFLSDCGRYISPEGDERPKVNGCRGGRVSHAIKFVDLAGAYEFMDYEFARRGLTFRDDKCAFPRPANLDHWQPAPNIPPTEVPAYHNVYYANLQLSEIDLHLRTVGPVFVNIRIWEGFKNYASGIVDSFTEAPDTVIHSMLLVGHDKDVHGKDYYIIWNSHGTSWGEDGFARIYAKSLDYFKIYIGGLVPVDASD